MLIPSPRHTAKDLELWREYEVADLIHGKRPALQRRVARSLSAIGEFIGRGPCYCGVSWGKDSVVVADLVRQVDPSIPLVHLRPTNHNPDCDEVREAYFATRTDQPYHEIAVDYSAIPHDAIDLDRDRLTDKRWNAAWQSASDRFGEHYISGIRAGEGRNRMMRCARWGESSINTCAPLAWWSAADIHGYLAINDLPSHPAYACLGGGRWPRDRIRTAEIGDTHGKGGGRREWEWEYYGEVLRRLAAGVNLQSTR